MAQSIPGRTSIFVRSSQFQYITKEPRADTLPRLIIISGTRNNGREMHAGLLTAGERDPRRRRIAGAQGGREPTLPRD